MATNKRSSHGPCPIALGVTGVRLAVVLIDLANKAERARACFLGVLIFLYHLARVLVQFFLMHAVPADALVRVSVLLRMLPEDHPGAGFLGTLDWFGIVFNGDRHIPGAFVSWWTHFALLLEYRSGEKWILERTDTAQNSGIVHRRLQKGCADIGIAECIGTVEWVGRKHRSDVEHFVSIQKEKQYSFLWNTCQHFAFMFFKDVLNNVHANGRFEDFTQKCQVLFRERDVTRYTILSEETGKMIPAGKCHN